MTREEARECRVQAICGEEVLKLRDSACFMATARLPNLSALIFQVSTPPVTKKQKHEGSHDAPAPPPEVYDNWATDGGNSSSDDIMRMAEAKERDKGRDKYTEDALKIEMSTAAFLTLSTAIQAFKNPKGEPDDWDFEGKHSTFKTSFRPEQPWLRLSWVPEDDSWEVRMHDGRHRVAWIGNHIGIHNVTVAVGFSWDKGEPGEDGGPFEDDVIIEGFRDDGKPPIRFNLKKNSRPGGVPWRLEPVT